MTISPKDWNSFVARLARINETAARKMGQYLQTHGYDNTQALIDYAYGLATKYGEASAALSAEWYDAIAALTRAPVPPAVPAATSTYEEVSHAVIGVVERSQNEDMLSGAVSRLVKQAGADTTVQNALRDRALWAWIPSGDTCAFCLALAANGWQRASRKTLRGNHASHIHANCNCTFAIQFDGKPAYAGYDPDRYREIYDNAAEGDFRDTVNAMRRAQYARDKEEINAQKRIAYGKRVSLEKRTPADVTAEYFANATPGKGSVAVDRGLQFGKHKKELRMAEWIHSTFGGNITVLKESLDFGVKMPDYSWRGKYWDLKTTSTLNATDSAVRKGLKQIAANPGGIILDYGHAAISIPDIQAVVGRRFARGNIGSIDVMIVSNGKAVKIFRYKK